MAIAANWGKYVESENANSTQIDYSGTGKTTVPYIGQSDDQNTRADQAAPRVVIELVIVEGPEGQQLHAIQSEVVRQILMRLAEQIQTPQKESP